MIGEIEKYVKCQLHPKQLHPDAQSHPDAVLSYRKINFFIHHNTPRQQTNIQAQSLIFSNLTQFVSGGTSLNYCKYFETQF
jgi:hypothetical protein